MSLVVNTEEKVIELTLVSQQGPAGASTVAAEAAALSAQQARLGSETARNQSQGFRNESEAFSIQAADSAQDAMDNAQFAAASATQSANSATSSAMSATQSANSAMASANSAVAAESAKTFAELALDKFEDIYLGNFASDPVNDNDGNPVMLGAIYFNTTFNHLRIYTSTGWDSAYFSPTDIVTEDELMMAFANHRNEADPHTQYTTVAEAAAAAPVQVSFKNIAVSGQGTVVADLPEDTVNLVAGNNIIITTDPMTDSITITSIAEAQAASLAVLDEGSLISSTVTSINFVGAGVTVNGNMSSVTVDVPSYNAFGVISGNTGTANADSVTDTISITGSLGITTTATDTPDGLVISPTYGTPGSILPDAIAAQGTADSFARSDHVHAISADTPVSLGMTAAEGTSNSFARADHVHPYPTAAQVGAASASFVNISVAGQDTVVADTTSDTLTLVAGTNISIITDPITDSITINSTASGSTSSTGDLAFISLGGY